MSGLSVSALNGCKIYNLSHGKTLPQWLTQRKRNALRKDAEYRRRVELLQGFEFKTASQCVKMTRDGEYCIVTGSYPPIVKVFDVSDLSMKFERHLDCEIVDFEVLSEDFGKICFLQADRTLAFHAPYGAHYSTRIPKFGRDLVYNPGTCDMYVAASGDEIYRLNLDEGRFRSPVSTLCQGINKIDINPVHQLVGAACEDSVVRFFDPRTPGAAQAAAEVDLVKPLAKRLGGASGLAAALANRPLESTAITFADDGLTVGVGTSTGHCMLFDLRSSNPVLVKDHQYQLPVTDVKFHEASRKVLSTDAKIIKIWERTGDANVDAGTILTNVETPVDINDVCVVASGAQGGQSGLLLVAGEQTRVMSYYVPALGPAPRWCSFLDGITEELEEEEGGSVYEDYKFITKQEVEALGITNLIGTNMLRGYMHGYFIDMQLYNRVRAVSNPFAYDEFRKKKLKEKMDAKHADRITIQKRLPKVNRALAARLMTDTNKKGKGKGKRRLREEGEEGEEGEEEEAAAAAAAAGDGSGQAKNPLGDSRFSKMFESTDFEIDEESAEFRLLNPSGVRKAPGAGVGDDQEEEDMDSEEEVLGERFTLVKDDLGDEAAGEVEGRGSDDDSDDDDDDDDYDGGDDGDDGSSWRDAAESRQKRQRKTKEADGQSATGGMKRRRPQMYELNEGERAPDVVGLGGETDRSRQRRRREISQLPLSNRLAAQQAAIGGSSDRSRTRVVVNADGGGTTREMTFTVAKAADDGEEREMARHSDEVPNGGRAKRGVDSLGLQKLWDGKKRSRGGGRAKI